MGQSLGKVRVLLGAAFVVSAACLWSCGDSSDTETGASESDAGHSFGGAAGSTQFCDAACDAAQSADCEGFASAECLSDCEEFTAQEQCADEIYALLECQSTASAADFECNDSGQPLLREGVCEAEIAAFVDCSPQA